MATGEGEEDECGEDGTDDDAHGMTLDELKEKAECRALVRHGHTGKNVGWETVAGFEVVHPPGVEPGTF